MSVTESHIHDAPGEGPLTAYTSRGSSSFGQGGIDTAWSFITNTTIHAGIRCEREQERLVASKCNASVMVRLKGFRVREMPASCFLPTAGKVGRRHARLIAKRIKAAAFP